MAVQRPSKKYQQCLLEFSVYEFLSLVRMSFLSLCCLPLHGSGCVFAISFALCAEVISAAVPAGPGLARCSGRCLGCTGTCGAPAFLFVPFFSHPSYDLKMVSEIFLILSSATPRRLCGFVFVWFLHCCHVHECFGDKFPEAFSFDAWSERCRQDCSVGRPLHTAWRSESQ